jgi:transposase
MSTGDLTDAQWARLAPLLPPQRPIKGSKGGRPAEDHRRIVNGLLWLDRSGARWRDMPERYGKWQTLATRFYRWQRQGIWQRILDALQAEADADGKLDWEVHLVDGTIVRAHQHAAGAKGGTQNPKL